MERKKKLTRKSKPELQKESGPWRPTNRQVLWAMGTLAALLTIVLLVGQLYPDLWKDLSQKRVAMFIGIGGALMVLIILLAFGGASRSWTGFKEKKLWDWLDLLSALAVPVVLAAAGFWFTVQQDARQQAIENHRSQAERALEEQRAQDEALQAYLSQMSTLLLEEDLGNPDQKNEAKTELAQARTLTVLRRLGVDRKRTVVEFLYETSLINKTNPIVDLEEANLSGANLSGVDLSGADLSSVNLQEADLREADLDSANLHSAHLSDANLREANLSHANLQEADLKEANLSGANLGDADLRESLSSFANNPISDGASGKEANLSGANLSGANLSDAEGVTEDTLEQQKARLGLASMPDGTGHAGQYVAAELEPSLSLTVSDGWRLATPETTSDLYIEYERGGDYGQLVFTNAPLNVFDPKSNPSKPKVDPAPDNAHEWVSWFQQNPNLKISNRKPVTLSGKSGVLIEVTAKSIPDNYSKYYCFEPCVPLYPSGDSAIASISGTKDRFYIVDVNRETVIIDVGTYEVWWDDFASVASMVLDTVEWKDAQKPPSANRDHSGLF
jgi:uncharacterized protein YjbI with pentapeptide repeats